VQSPRQFSNPWEPTKSSADPVTALWVRRGAALPGQPGISTRGKLRPDPGPKKANEFSR
jgi:hypothetical protein